MRKTGRKRKSELWLAVESAADRFAAAMKTANLDWIVESEGLTLKMQDEWHCYLAAARKYTRG